MGGGIRIPRIDCGIKGAQKGKARFKLDEGDDGLMLTEAEDEERGSDKKLPKPHAVRGLTLKFNAAAWVENFGEMKAVFGPDGEVFATGTLLFADKRKTKEPAKRK